MGTKWCKHCASDLPVSAFYKDSKRSDGRTAYCKRYYAEYYAANRTRQKETSLRNASLRRYGVPREEYEQLIAQGCSVCGPAATGRVVLDHCHATDSVRAPLCDGCNIALGAAKDSPKRLRSLADYVETHAAVK